jgi:hypothetical protein
VHNRGLGALTVARPSRPAVIGALPRSLYLETTNRCDSQLDSPVALRFLARFLGTALAGYAFLSTALRAARHEP